MLRKYLFLLFLAASLVCFESCSINAEDNDDEVVLNTAELNAAKIKELINAKDPDIVDAYIYDTEKISNWDLVVGSSNYELSGTFIRIDNYHFNLENLHHFRYNGSDLELYFSINK